MKINRQDASRPAPSQPAAAPRIAEPAARPAARPAAQPADGPAAPAKKRRRPWLLILLILLLLAGMLFSGWKVVTTLAAYRRASSAWEELADQAVTLREEPAAPAATEAPFVLPTAAPIDVDWDFVMSRNSHIIGWLYSPGTAISYPVVQTTNNDDFLRHDLDGRYSIAGTLFADAVSQLGVGRSNFIIYGHHMNDGTMFASLAEYTEQEYYEEHPYLFFLTPDQNYRVDLYACYIVESVQESYPGYFMSSDDLQLYMDLGAEQSFFTAHVTPSAEYQLFTMSTCDYTETYNDPRMLVQGMMVPVD